MASDIDLQVLHQLGRDCHDIFLQILHPFMLRRIKTDVELMLPPKKELLVFTPLSPVQDEMYRAILNKSIHEFLLPEVN